MSRALPLTVVTALVLSVGLGACQKPGKDLSTQAVAQIAHDPGWNGAGANLAPNDPPGEWRRPARDYAGTRYSPLNQVNAGNVAELKMAWSFSDGVPYGHEGAPLVADNTMYLVTPFPNIAYALDLTKPGSPIKWTYSPNPSPMAIGKACCDAVLRGWALANGKLIFNTLDGQTVAVNADNGQEIWRAALGDFHKGETITMAPLVVKGKVLVGDAGGEFGVRGWLQALDANTGKVVWKAYSTGPDSDVLIGPDFKPHYAMDQGKDLGVATWPADAWKKGGGTVWGWISYDPAMNLIYYGTSNPGPWNAEKRPGDNKWTAGIFARDPDTGAAKWFYQLNPHDMHDYDAVNESLLIEAPINGQLRKVAARTERNGYVYLLDRATGEVLSADPYGPVNSSKGVDLKTGRLIVNPEKSQQPGKVVRDICPTASGSKDWNPSAFSPRTGLIYIPHTNICMDWQTDPASYISGTPYVGATVRMKPGPGGNRGAMTAWDPVRRAIVWEIKEDLPLWSGALATGGDVVFYGTLDGWFKAADARTGKVLWQFRCASGIIAPPIAYRGPDGHEYVAVLAGVGGWGGAIVKNDLDPRDPTAALGMVGVTADLKSKTTPGGILYVFSLP